MINIMTLRLLFSLLHRRQIYSVPWLKCETFWHNHNRRIGKYEILTREIRLNGVNSVDFQGSAESRFKLVLIVTNLAIALLNSGVATDRQAGADRSLAMAWIAHTKET